MQLTEKVTRMYLIILIILLCEKKENKFARWMDLFKEGFLPNMFNKMFLLTKQLHSYTLETLIHFTYITVE